MIREFYTNAWVTYKHIKDVNPEFKTWLTMLRGRILELTSDQRLDQILTDICLPRAQWKRDARDQPYQLGRPDLKSIGRGWVEFIQCSIIPTSNRSEPQRPPLLLGWPSLTSSSALVRLIASALSETPLLTSTGRSLRGGMEYAKEFGRAPPQEPVSPPRQEQSEMPQGSYFSPRDYWDQLTASVGS
ncbi:hypothetical protein AHAS_Ahas13G0182500 [Arachis hypogaea]